VAKEMKEMSALYIYIYIYVKNDLKSKRKMLWRIIFANKFLMMMSCMLCSAGVKRMRSHQ
jgi:hypothetical protein